MIAVIMGALLASSTTPVRAFTPLPAATTTVTPTTTTPQRATFTAVHVLGKKKKTPKEDLSFIETRDMTREEMLELNQKNEDIMNMELQAMTGFSLVLSLPILYLCWVAFFSD